MQTSENLNNSVAKGFGKPHGDWHDIILTNMQNWNYEIFHDTNWHKINNVYLMEL